MFGHTHIDVSDRHFKTRTRTQVVIDAAKFLEEKLAGKPIDILTAKLGHACGATGYFKKTKIKDFYAGLYDNIKGAKSDWDKQTQVTTIFHSVGAFTYCPSDLILKIAKYLVSYYIGKPGGYGYYGQNRAVFYSNGAAPIISRIIQHSEQNLCPPRCTCLSARGTELKMYCFAYS